VHPEYSATLNEAGCIHLSSLAPGRLLATFVCKVIQEAVFTIFGSRRLQPVIQTFHCLTLPSPKMMFEANFHIHTVLLHLDTTKVLSTN
jgi:hypothetical protein